ncbi:MAG: Fe2+-dependent dioxygenase, partial [Gammaproteobacteria bacterium]
GVLNPAQIEEVQRLLADAPFQDGKYSAGKEARIVKHNEEMVQEHERYARLNEIVMRALVNHPRFQQAALPLRVASPFYARYRPGMTYGDHVDDPIMGPMTGRYRTDVSTTVFLNAPEDYEGGELVIRTSYGETRFKGEAGSAVVYPSHSLHRVAPVQSGERLVAVTWTQSLVRDAARRELLFELSEAREALLDRAPTDPATARVSRCYVNLLRMWAEL